jgi:hypothetical protein
MKESPRELLAEADRQRSIARGAESARINYRLGRSAVAHRRTGLFGWTKDRSKAPDPKVFKTLPPGVDTAVYVALGIVAREAEATAKKLEARVTADAVYLCTDCKRTWEFAWGCG